MAELFADIGAPDWGLTEQSQDSITNVQFGDGYHLRVPDGINYKRFGWTPNWSFLDPVDAQTAFEWLDERKNLVAFDWNHPTRGIVRVLCTDVKKTDSEYNNSTLSVTLVEDFNP